MRKLIGLCTLGTTILAGCAGNSAVDQVRAACTYADGNLSASCVSKHPSFASLPKEAQRQVAYRVMLTEQIDAKKLTQAQADFLQQEYEGKLLTEGKVAAAANSQAASNAMMSTGAALLAADAVSRQPAVIYPAPQKMFPTTTTCMGGYRSVTCNNF